MAQFILDCFPDNVSQFGLLGCASVVLMALGMVLALYHAACSVVLAAIDRGADKRDAARFAYLSRTNGKRWGN